MRRTVAVLEQQSWPGGAQRVLESTLEALDPDYDCIVAFPDCGPFRTSLEARGIETLTLAVGTYRPGRKTCFDALRLLARSLFSALRLARLIRRRRISLIYINGPRCLPAGAVAARLTGRPAVFHLHLILTRRVDLFVTTGLLSWVSQIVACSDAAAAPLLRRNPKLSVKTRTLYNPRPTRGRSPSRDRGEVFTLGTVARITETKGHHLLLVAVSKLPPLLRERVRLLLVGSTAPVCAADRLYEARLTRLIAWLGLEKRVVWVGHQADPGPWYAQMDVLVHPALSEALCLAILEALQQGVPVIAARTGGIPEVVRDGANGLLVQPNDAGAIAEAIRRFLEDDAIRARLRAGAASGLDQRFAPETFRAGIRRAVASGERMVVN